MPRIKVLAISSVQKKVQSVCLMRMHTLFLNPYEIHFLFTHLWVFLSLLSNPWWTYFCLVTFLLLGVVTVLWTLLFFCQFANFEKAFFLIGTIMNPFFIIPYTDAKDDAKVSTNEEKRESTNDITYIPRAIPASRKPAEAPPDDAAKTGCKHVFTC